MRFLGIIFIVICTTMQAADVWPVFYDAEKEPSSISIVKKPMPLDVLIGSVPSWDIELSSPTAQIRSHKIKELGRLGDKRILEVRLTLGDSYYTDALWILQERESGGFLPIYVQNYNRDIRMPSPTAVLSISKDSLVAISTIDYSGTGHFHSTYKIVVSPIGAPSVTKEK